MAYEDYWCKIQNVNEKRKKKGKKKREVEEEKFFVSSSSARRLPIMRIEILELSLVDYRRKELTEADYSLKRFTRLVILFK